MSIAKSCQLFTCDAFRTRKTQDQFFVNHTYRIFICNKLFRLSLLNNLLALRPCKVLFDGLRVWRRNRRECRMSHTSSNTPAFDSLSQQPTSGTLFTTYLRSLDRHTRFSRIQRNLIKCKRNTRSKSMRTLLCVIFRNALKNSTIAVSQPTPLSSHDLTANTPLLPTLHS